MRGKMLGFVSTRAAGRAATLAFLSLLLFGTPALAGDEPAGDEVTRIKARIEKLEESQEQLLVSAIEGYLRNNPRFEGAQGSGGGWTDRTTIHANFTGVVQGTVDYCNSNSTVADGDVDLNFDFEVTDNLDLFVYLTANADAGFPPLKDGTFTASGATDGIGVNGTVPTDPGSVTVYDAGIHHALPVGERTLHWEIGALDPRTRFSQNAFADDENTQFINNLFDDSPSVLWLSDRTGRTALGVHAWIAFGDNEQWTLNCGWFNTPGQFFNKGQFLVQLHYAGELNGRAMNVRGFGFVDEFFVDGLGDGSSGGGLSWDWQATDQLGVFVRITASDGVVNVVELDASFGAAYTGLFGSRPDDVIGLAIGFISLQNGTSFGTLPEDTEVHVEVYYRAMFEGGDLQVTPHLLYVSDPGAGTGASDALWILGLRIHVPF